MNLKTLYNFYAQQPEGSWIMKPDNARMLSDFVKSHEVKNILDLGTGIGASAAVVALALKDKKREGKIVTVEQNEKCFKIAQEILPEELKSLVEFRLFSPDVQIIDGIPYTFFSRFSELPPQPEGGWDLIITDGPGEFMKDGKFINLPNCDALQLLLKNEIKPGAFLFFDGRMGALLTLERYFSDNFYSLEAVNNRCNILERKDNPVALKDSRIEMFEKNGYFK